MNFKPGDRVRCISSSNDRRTFGSKIYEVVSSGDRYVYLKDKDWGAEGWGGWYNEHFELIPPPTPLEKSIARYVKSEKRALGLL